MRIFKLLSVKDVLKRTVLFTIFFHFVYILYLRLAKDWCSEGHDLCCEVKTTQFQSELAQFFSRNTADVIPHTEMEYENFLINPHTLCTDNDVIHDIFLLIIVTSAPDNFEQRHAIRYTWGLYARDSDVTVKLAFMIGSSSSNISQHRIKKESITNRDIIQASFVDSYRNLTMKTMSLLHWIRRNCIQAKYVMKTDDDLFVHIPNLITLLHRFKDNTRMILGAIGVSEKPWRNVTDKWYLDPRVYPFSHLPVFAHGPGYVISGDLIAILLDISRRLKPLWLEDVFITGICAQGADVTFVGNCGFRTGKRSDEEWIMGSHVITGHKYLPQDMRTLWNKLHNWGMYSYFVHLYAKIMGL